MPAASQSIKVSWIPRGDQKGGQFSNATYHDMVPDSTYQVVGCIVKNNSWMPIKNLAQVGALNSRPVTTLEVFNRYSGFSQALTSSLISGLTNDSTGKASVINQTTGAIIRGPLTPMGTTGPGRYVFASVKNRLYMSNGNGTDLPAISVDGTASSCIQWGFYPQTTNLSAQINQSNQLGAGTPNSAWLGGSIGTCNVAAGGTSVTWVSGPNFEYFVSGVTIVVNGFRTTVQSVATTTTMTLNNSIGAGPFAGVPFSYAPSGMTGSANFTNASAVFGGWTGPTLVAGPPSFPSTGVAIYPATVKYNVGSITGGAAGTLTGNFQQATAAYTTEINISNISWDSLIAGTGYQYAVSYYNPTSGHVSNPSPILAVNNGPPQNCNVSVTIQGIKCINDAAYTKIILWRSGNNSTTCYPLAVLNNNLGNDLSNTITYTDILGDDTQLGAVSTPYAGSLLNANIGKLGMPTGQNAPPPADLNYATYWQGRFWGASQTQIGLVFYSARSAGNNEDTTVGVPEECWPPDFTLPIPESDGRVTGFRALGSGFLVLTDNSIYQVLGSSKLDYQLLKVSSKGKGTSHFATCVIPGEDVNSTDVLVHYGNDGRLYFLFGSGGDFPISYPIQDEFDAVGAPASAVTVGVYHTSVSTYIYVSIGGAYFIYDLERKIWLVSQTTTGTAFVEGLYNGSIAYFVGRDATNGVYQGEQTSGSPVAESIITNIVAPGPPDTRKDDKILQSLTIYSNDPTAMATATVAVTIDSGTVPLVLVPTTAPYSAFKEAQDAFVFVPQSVCRSRLFQFIVDLTPSFFTTSTTELLATFSYAQADEAKGASF